MNELKPKATKQHNRSPLPLHSNTVNHTNTNENQSEQNITKDIRRIEQMERDDPSEETQNLINRCKELAKPGEYRTSKGVWKKYNPPKQHRAEIKRMEMTLNQKRNRLLWDKMEKNNKESEDERSRREELHRVIENFRNTPKNNHEIQPETSRKLRENSESPDTIETASTNSNDSFGVPAINFKRYLGATGV